MAFSPSGRPMSARVSSGSRVPATPIRVSLQGMGSPVLASRTSKDRPPSGSRRTGAGAGGAAPVAGRQRATVNSAAPPTTAPKASARRREPEVTDERNGRAAMGRIIAAVRQAGHLPAPWSYPCLDPPDTPALCYAEVRPPRSSMLWGWIDHPAMGRGGGLCWKSLLIERQSKGEYESHEEG